MTQSRTKIFQGVRTRRVLIAAEEAAPRFVSIPIGWDDSAAACLAETLPGRKPIDLVAAVQDWLVRLPEAARPAASSWLLARRAAPDAAVWRGETGMFGLNLGAFDEPGPGFDAPALRETAILAAALAPGGVPALRLTDLDGMLAAAGLAYDSAAGRDHARAVCTMLREATGARLTADPDPADALLGAEAAGIAPRFSWLDAEGRLSRGALARLAAAGKSAEQALAEALEGGSPLPLADRAAHEAMRAALAGLVESPAPALPDAASARREPPARAGGQARKVAVGGHKLFVRTTEYEDGRLAEFSLALPKESASVRAMADVVAQVASLALQYGVPLPEILDLLAGTKFGPAGAVEGDAEVRRASSPLDYLARSLAAAYAADAALPDPEEDTPEPALPLDLPHQERRPRLRIVSGHS